MAKGLAAKVGDAIPKPLTIPPVAIFFEAVARSAPEDSTSPLEGMGRFQMEAYLLHLLGFPVQDFNKADLLATRWLVDGLLPFIMLISLSYLLPGRRRTEEEQRQVDGFFAKLKTPVAPTPEEDDREVALSYENPHRFDHEKFFPRSTWELTKWNETDWLGFLGCWGVVGLIVGFLWLVVHAGA